MRLKKRMMACFLVIAMVLMNCPVQAANPRMPYFATVGGKAVVTAGQTYRSVMGGNERYPYYTSPTSTSVMGTVEGNEFTMKNFVDLHMAPATTWQVERIEDEVVLGWSTDINNNTIPSNTYYWQYKIYPTSTYYSVNYILNGATWTDSTRWVENDKVIDYGIWSSTTPIEGYTGNIWFAPAGYSVVLPALNELGKSGFDLEWKVGGTSKAPGEHYSLSVTDAVYNDVTGDSAINIEAIWHEKSIEVPVVSQVTTEGASFSANYKAYGLGASGFRYKKSTDTSWTQLPATGNGTELTANVDSLERNTTYEVKGYIQTITGEIETSAVRFTTLKNPQTVTPTVVDGITAQGASFKASYASDDTLTNQGFRYKKSTDSSWTDLAATVSGSTITAVADTLSSNTTYDVKGYIQAAAETQTTAVSFTTLKKAQAVDSVAISNITTEGASFKVGYTSDDTLNKQGFRYKKSTDSSWIELVATVSGSEFATTVSGLASDTTYQVKGYIQTAAGETETAIASFTSVKSSSGGSDNSGGSGNSGDSDDSSDSGSTGGTSSTGGSGSAGATSATGDTTAQQVASSIDKAIEKGDTPTIAVDSSYNAQVPVEALEAIVKAGQELVVQSGSVGVAFNAQAVETLLGNNNTVTPLQITTAPIAPTALEQIKQQLSQAQEGTVLGGSELTLSLSVQAAQQIDTFVEPLDIQMDLSKVDVKDASKLTLVRYETQKDGSVTTVKLGGKYDKKTKSFTAKTGEPGHYGVMVVENLTQITLKIDHNEIEIDGKKVQNDVAPEIIGDVTMMPLRAIAESLGATVEWDDTLKQAVILLDGKRLVVGKEQGMILKEKEGRTMVPVRYIAEHLGANVLWVPSTRQVQIVR